METGFSRTNRTTSIMDERLPNIVYFDLETIKVSDDFEDKWGAAIQCWDDPTKKLTNTSILKMGFGVACTHDNDNTRLWRDPTELLLYLISDAVDAICTFNGEAFDFPVLIASIDDTSFDPEKHEFSDTFKNVYSQLKCKSLDLLVHIESSLGHRISLEQVKIAQQDTPKISSGKDFWRLFNSTNIDDRILSTNYLIDDVYRLKKIYAISEVFGLSAYRDALGNTKRFTLKLPTLEDLKKK